MLALFGAGAAGFDERAALAISAYVSRIARTPNIERVATGGVRFTNCFRTNSRCMPSRSANLEAVCAAQSPHLLSPADLRTALYY
jgi:hypothetical protein